MPQIANQVLEIEDFSGGSTDNYINCPTNMGQTFDNLFILPNKKLQSRWGSHVDDTTNPRIPAGNQRIGSLINYNNSATLFVQSAKKLYYRNPSAYTTLTGPTSNDVFNEGSTSSFISHSEWNRHLYVTNDSFPNIQKIYLAAAGTLQTRTAGMPALANAPTVTAGTASTRSYIYAFIYYYTYTIGSQVFEDRGPVTQVELASSADPSSSNNAISVIPVLANSTVNNYDTTAVKVHIFRTLDGETEFFKIGEVTNGTTVFTDNVSDATAADGEALYTTGGVLDRDPPPLAKYIHIVNNSGYYGHIKVGSETFPNSYRISLRGAPDAVPTLFEDEVEDEITGMNSVQSIPIVLCKRHIYRSEGSFDETGRGSLNHVRISDTAGCISNLSCVQAEGGLYWAGNDGFYYTDGYRVLKISDHRNTSYATYVAAMSNTKKIVGAFDEKHRRIIWTIQADSSSDDNDGCVVLELRWGISPNMVFTTMSGGEFFSPTYLAFFDGEMYRAQTNGYVFVHSEDDVVDPLVDIDESDVTLWANNTIIYTYRGPALNFGTTMGRKWVPKAIITLGNQGNVSVQPNAINDDGASTRPLKEIRFRGNFVWGSAEFLWGSPDCVWGSSGIIEQWRRMPARGLRLSYFQLELTNAYTIITNSDIMGNATLAAAETATLDDADVNWPDDSVGYFLSFEDDDYETQYEVSERTSDSVLTFIDSGSTSATGSKEWLLKGYKKGEILNLLSYAVLFSSNSQSHATFQRSESGENQ